MTIKVDCVGTNKMSCLKKQYVMVVYWICVTDGQQEGTNVPLNAAESISASTLFGNCLVLNTEMVIRNAGPSWTYCGVAGLQLWDKGQWCSPVLPGRKTVNYWSPSCFWYCILSTVDGFWLNLLIKIFPSNVFSYTF